MKHHPYNLRGSSLEVYSALYSLTKKKAFVGSYQELADWIEIEKTTVFRTIKKLQERGLVYVEQQSFSRYEFQAYPIKGYPLPDYKYYGRKSVTDYPVTDTQNIEEYRPEIEAFERQQASAENTREPLQNATVPLQNATVPLQNVPISKEKNQKKNNNNILTLKKEEGKKDGQAVSSSSKKINEEEEKEPFPPTWEMVINYAIAKQPGISVEMVREWFAHRENHEWKMAKGDRIMKWRADLFLWDQRGKRFAKEDAARRATCAQAGGQYKYNTRRAEETNLLRCIEGRKRERAASMEQKIQRDAEAQRQELLRRQEEGYYK